MVAEHKFLRFLLPSSWFEAVRRGTKEWLAECPEGHVWDFWDGGWIRYKAAGKPRRMLRCPQCERARWHTMRRKTPQEKLDLP